MPPSDTFRQSFYAGNSYPAISPETEVKTDIRPGVPEVIQYPLQIMSITENRQTTPFSTFRQIFHKNWFSRQITGTGSENSKTTGRSRGNLTSSTNYIHYRKLSDALFWHFSSVLCWKYISRQIPGNGSEKWNITICSRGNSMPSTNYVHYTKQSDNSFCHFLLIDREMKPSTSLTGNPGKLYLDAA